MPRSPGDDQGVDYQLDDPEYPLVNGAVILVVRLRQIGRGGHQAEWVNGNGGGFADGWQNSYRFRGPTRPDGHHEQSAASALPRF